MGGILERVEDFISGEQVLVLFYPSAAEYEKYVESVGEGVVVVGRENVWGAEDFIELPLEFEDIKEKIRFGLEGAIRNGMISDGDDVVCISKLFSNELDSIMKVRVEESQLNSGIYAFFLNSKSDAGVIRDVLELVIELGKKGQNGEPVGALFTVGDAGKVMNKSCPLSYNPFEKSHVHVGDSIVNVMLKEFSRLDGAFVISDEGKIVSAYRYLEASSEGLNIPKGLGTRHMAGAAISKDTSAISVVLSESDGLVRCFKSGELVLEIDPEAY
ncbi:diadenylate cyclase domain-containing protein [Candidatus Hikarchaeum yamanae]|uniref:diadenylate cyclase domain-containing protein n=1 Tax=Candidatus Hikarchaeum yamanae TaxID=2675326 RepID=UPI0039EA0C66|tara:strand:+ start:11323 stop:12138 length:816 start_codon:yes stop_codon:yes gene_type:complete